MSRITNSESINLSDSYTVLLDETLRENRVLRAMLIEQDEQNVRNFRGLSDKVESLCHLMSERNHAEPNERLLKKKSTSKVHVPSRCRVSLGCLNCFFMIKQLRFVKKNLKAKLKTGVYWFRRANFSCRCDQKLILFFLRVLRVCFLVSDWQKLKLYFHAGY